jgi:hypothetical protein
MKRILIVIYYLFHNEKFTKRDSSDKLKIIKLSKGLYEVHVQLTLFAECRAVPTIQQHPLGSAPYTRPPLTTRHHLSPLMVYFYLSEDLNWMFSYRL